MVSDCVTCFIIPFPNVNSHPLPSNPTSPSRMHRPSSNSVAPTTSSSSSSSPPPTISLDKHDTFTPEIIHSLTPQLIETPENIQKWESTGEMPLLALHEDLEMMIKFGIFSQSWTQYITQFVAVFQMLMLSLWWVFIIDWIAFPVAVLSLVDMTTQFLVVRRIRNVKQGMVSCISFGKLKEMKKKIMGNRISVGINSAVLVFVMMMDSNSLWMKEGLAQREWIIAVCCTVYVVGLIIVGLSQTTAL
eukprot:TRINITY_DN6069_c0_g1_i2.p1 TRINITY_DN6069_c0_g1~~TRINITY_DN6069_c0_g1_i2.p1  ORF type:complete len:246 (-),score=61.67 TRINITY_DN6069_c0_g1_i2:82-819(-)